MYVCICNGITESELLSLADKLPLATDAMSEPSARPMLERASAILGVGTGCGRCLQFAEGLLEQRAGSAALVSCPASF